MRVVGGCPQCGMALAHVDGGVIIIVALFSLDQAHTLLLLLLLLSLFLSLLLESHPIEIERERAFERAPVCV